MTELQFPISIALVGAPGSGKTIVAEEFQRISKDWFSEVHSICECDLDEAKTKGCSRCGNPLRIIANAGNVLEQERDTPMGIFGGYAEDLRAYFLQFEQERQALAEGASFISLGTSLQNLAHAGVTLETLLTGLQTPDAARRVQQGQVTMSLLTFLFMERFRYTFGFYIPSSAGVVLPGADDTDRQYNQRVDAALRAIFVNFGVRIQVLDQPTVEERAAAMFETVKDIVENGPKRPESETETGESADEGGSVPPVDESTLVV